MKTVFIIYVVYVLVLSFITFLAYGIDKRKAVKDKKRISEKKLLLMSIFGGAIGGLIGMKTFRHKTMTTMPCSWPMWWTSTTDIMVRAPAAYTCLVILTSPYWRVWSRSSAWQSGGVERKWKVESGEMKVIAIWMRTILFHL